MSFLAVETLMTPFLSCTSRYTTSLKVFFGVFEPHSFPGIQVLTGNTKYLEVNRGYSKGEILYKLFTSSSKSWGLSWIGEAFIGIDTPCVGR